DRPMSMLSSLKGWAGKRRRLLPGLVGVAVETAASSVPGVNLAAKFLGDVVEKATDHVLDPQTGQPMSPHPITHINPWLGNPSTAYAGLLDRLEQMPLPSPAPWRS